ncbi:MAG: hypothetical protein WC553_02635 [Patescibacteria group bacterium]|jgi:hypothetical protein
MKKFLYWFPRGLAILVVVFLSAFILEGLGPDFGWQDSLSHALIAIVVLAVTIVAWRWPKFGGWIFVLLGGFYLVMIVKEQWWGGLVIGGVPLLVGVMFLIEGFGKGGKKD